MIVSLYIFGCILLIFSLLPLIRNDYWTFRVFEYPRIQKLLLVILWFLMFFLFTDNRPLALNILFVALVLNAVYLAWQIAPYTPLGKKQVYKIKQDNHDNQLAVMISNVYEDNTNYQGCINEINKAQPDLILLLETNHEWEKKTEILDDTYNYQVKVPIDNTYGMLLFSKFPIHEPQVHYLVEENIPSIFCKIKLPSGQLVQVYAVHPTPPVPNENPRSTERDKELLLVAKKAVKQKLPVLVIGDLNDVAWSYTTELFLKTSKLLDPRRGRGFFNTFHAKIPFLQFPLDHAFISADFKLINIKKLDNFDSDHYPIYVKIQFEKQADAEQAENELEADADDKKLVQEKINADT
ncbi:endonuclease/exonuclease/phosphatase family protein [Sphingobacterium lactis]|uniref:endonuclease/exonuclease/phosphatase family protein n=1 Tax=Sphingobacterium lactis TaxID=797291 RepID=UPI003F7CDF69